MARKPRPTTAAFTVRTTQAHRDALDDVATVLGTTRQDLVAIIVGKACGLGHPAGTPRVPVDLETLPQLVESARQNRDQEEVLTQTT